MACTSAAVSSTSSHAAATHAATKTASTTGTKESEGASTRATPSAPASTSKASGSKSASSTKTSSGAAASSTSTSSGGSDLTDGTSPDVVGTVYFITNDPTENNIVLANIGKDGNVTFAGLVSAGGKGVHGDDGGQFASDATYSNGIITVSESNNFLATTNTQSGTVALFKIDPNDPSKLEMAGQPVSSQGDFPTSVAFNHAGDRLCVMNSGTKATLLCYGVSASGLSTQQESLRDLTIFGYNQTNPPQGPINTFSQVVFTEDDKNVVVALKGYITPAPTRGALFTYPINGNGELAKEPILAGTPAPGGFTFSMTPIPGKNAFFSADFSSGLNVWDFNEGVEKVNSSESKTVAKFVDGEITTCWSTWAPTIDRYYLSDPSTCLVTEVVVDPNTLAPTVVANHTLVEGGENIDVAVGTVDGTDYLYANLATGVGIAVLRLDGPGQSTMVGVANMTEPVKQAGATITPNYIQGMAVYMKGRGNK
ncbi:hypothetical protein PENSPDRAFT_643713 [Peniophora sp. CONT]|nr:hypothetical protein PENSPDRAFT_643713 [Peniophora sp. CONT]